MLNFRELKMIVNNDIDNNIDANNIDDNNINNNNNDDNNIDNKIIFYPLIRKKKENKLIKWLNSSNEYFDSDYKYLYDANELSSLYTKSYKSFFNINDIYNTIYKQNDIDIQISNVNKQNFDIDYFGDYLDITNCEGYENYVLILPHTNHNNCNYIYKLLMRHIKNENFLIPKINDYTKEYDGNYDYMQLDIDKEELYNFLYEMS